MRKRPQRPAAARLWMHPPRARARRSLPSSSTTLSFRSSSCSSCSRLPLLVAAASALVVSLWPRSCRSAFSPPALHIPIRRRACTPDGALLSLLSFTSHPLHHIHLGTSSRSALLLARAAPPPLPLFASPPRRLCCVSHPSVLLPAPSASPCASPPSLRPC
ncbi:hypothetical protein FA09DRAFT_199389 [Tilletiopsis washingtonensis]|uniref:Uncharacterized protein n=1 Tax=Tilletiopsis washingtonensis TaxID=58919 RepID=A0A316ZG90_9BASI|nr:hypothetical protein FA09DRAFT_199389 [Tilletiopsis washingtonensis]PWN99942.1 hypothetical protein FA09DRAFT_199389 [Tilletiopsis washingtonensis]